MMQTKPMKNITVLESHSPDDSTAITQSIAFCGRIFADLGARVLSNSNPVVFHSDASRNFLNRGKEMVSSLPAGTESAHQTLALSGHSNLPQARINVGFNLFPEAVGEIPASAFTVMATGGLLDIVGEPDRAPLQLPNSQLLRAAGLSAFTAGAALLHADKVACARVTLLDVAIWLNWKNLVVARETGRAPSRQGRGAEWQTLRCADGWIGLVYRENDWAAVKRLIDDPSLDAAHYDNRGDRKQRAAEIARIAELKFATMTRASIMEFARDNRVPFAPVLTTREVLSDHQTVARSAFVTTKNGVMPRLPVLWNNRPLLSDGALA